MMESHPFLFPNFKRPSADWMPEYSPVARKDSPFTDPMGCTWTTADDGITGTVIGHPLDDWSKFGTGWKIPDPETCNGLYPVDWATLEKEWKIIKDGGGTFYGSLRHGHTFLQLCDLRGYENLMFDMVDDVPHLYDLIEQLNIPCFFLGK